MLDEYCFCIFQKLDASEMLQHISNVRQAVRFAVSDLKDENLPGFCIPKKVCIRLLKYFTNIPKQLNLP